MILISLIFSLVGNNCYAQTDAEETTVLYLSQGDRAPYGGYLLTPTHAKLIADQLQDYDKTLLLNKSLTASIDLYKANETVYKTEIGQLTDQNESLSKAVVDAKHDNTFSEIVYFALGIVTTSLIVYVSHR